MLKDIELQLFAEGEDTGVEGTAAAGQELTAQETPQDTTQEPTEGTQPISTAQENAGVKPQAVAEPNVAVEKAFAARLKEAVEKAKQEALKSHPALSYLEQKAQRLGITVEQLIENDRKYEEQEQLNKLIQQNIPEEYARKLLEHDKIMQEYMTEKQIREQKEKEQQMYLEFLDAYPDVKPEDIPAEVWQEVNKGRNLTDAYTRYENKRLKEEMAKLQQLHQTQQVNEKNAASSTGSIKSSGATGGYISREEFDANKHDINWVRKNLQLIEDSRKHWK